MLGDTVTIRAARADDLAAVRALLSDAQLPLDGLDEQFGEGYAVAESAGAVIGAEGIETYDNAGLLRSAVVADAWRGHGIGDALTRDRLDWARSRGLREIYLLTTTAADYFPRHGFARVDRSSAPPAVQSSREFAEACPQTAVAMRLVLHSPTTT
jgi:amino-acid N-acetyltransferase